MRFASLGSGSRGNALVVVCGATHVMVDCGFGLREALTRLGRLDLVPEDLSAIIVTHEHGDHVSGVFPLARRHSLTVWMTPGTLASAPKIDGEPPEVRPIVGHACFCIGDLEVRPFPVPHDAREPAQFVFHDGHHSLGILTDCGRSTPHIETMLSGCDALVLECNHDLDMLSSGEYPPGLKKRIAGCFGHMDNAASATLLASIDTRRLQHIVAAHLSQENNKPELARAALAQPLRCEPHWVTIADQDEGFGWREIL